MALAETWMNDYERRHLIQCQYINEFKRERVTAGGVALYEKKDIVCSI